MPIHYDGETWSTHFENTVLPPQPFQLLQVRASSSKTEACLKPGTGPGALRFKVDDPAVVTVLTSWRYRGGPQAKFLWKMEERLKKNSGQLGRYVELTKQRFTMHFQYIHAKWFCCNIMSAFQAALLHMTPICPSWLLPQVLHELWPGALQQLERQKLHLPSAQNRLETKRLLVKLGVAQTQGIPTTYK